MKQVSVTKSLKLEPGLQRIRDAGPFLDFLSPFFAFIWVVISFIPVLVSLITKQAFPGGEILNAYLCIEFIALLSRQGFSLSSWLSDTTNYANRVKQNDTFANTLRGSQLVLTLISLGMYSVTFFKTVATLAAPLLTALTALAQSPIIITLVNICQYVPLISIIAGILGTTFYFYQAYRAHQTVKRYQARIDKLDEQYHKYKSLYLELLKPNANIEQLCEKLPSDAKNYLFERHLLEKERHEKQKARTGFIFWGVIIGVNLAMSAVTAIVTLTPLGGIGIAAGVTFNIALKAPLIIVPLVISAVTFVYYFFNRFNNPTDKKLAKAATNIDNAMSYLNQKASRYDNKEKIHQKLQQLTNAPPQQATSAFGKHKGRKRGFFDKRPDEDSSESSALEKTHEKRFEF